MLCKDCNHLKSKQVGYVSSRSWCGISKGSALNGTKLGVYPWLNKPHPKCPLIKKESEE